jgi:serine/threonine protein kinase
MSLCINPQCSQSENLAETLFCQGCGSELLLAGKYRVTKLMSRKGGFGDTYEVTERGVPKVLKLLKSDNPKAIELFEREFRVLNSLKVTGIVGIPQVEDLFLYSPRQSPQPLNCLVMERVYGMDLEEYIKVMNRSLDEKTAIGWLSQLTQILQEIHAQGILHRDIKPSNIILQPDGQLVLIDFGAVKEAATQSMGQATLLYTPGYTAPEQQTLGTASIQSDFFALGRTFVYLLTAKNPTNIYDSFRDLLIWRDQTANISPQFLDLIDRLMQTDPLQRPDHAATIFQAIATITAANTTQITAYQLSPATNQNSGFFQPARSSQILTPVGTAAPSSSLNVIGVKGRSKDIWTLLTTNRLPLLVGLAIFAAWLFWPKSPNLVTASNKMGESFTEITDVPRGVFRYGGSTTWATTRQLQSSIDASIKGVFPKYEIVYTDASSPDMRSAKAGKCESKPGSNAGICWLIEGDLDFSQSSVMLEKSKYAADVQVNHLKQEAVAYDALTIVVNPQLKIPGLTVAQLRDIYTGRVTNWREVGGPDLKIVAFSRDESAGGTVSSFKDLVLNKGDILRYQKVGNTTAGLNQVKNQRGGIYYGAGKELIVDSCYTQPIAIGIGKDNLVKPYQEPLQSLAACTQGQRNRINTEVVKNQAYPLTRKIYVIIKADGTDRQKAGEAYANLLRTKQGQELLEKAGFVSILN